MMNTRTIKVKKILMTTAIRKIIIKTVIMAIIIIMIVITFKICYRLKKHKNDIIEQREFKLNQFMSTKRREYVQKTIVCQIAKVSRRKYLKKIQKAKLYKRKIVGGVSYKKRTKRKSRSYTTYHELLCHLVMMSTCHLSGYSECYYNI